ncbi:MAG: 2-hydroxyacyl-CoA dehydratase [Candidatus Marinimicrobia bacterium]|nr:2-hydroxyacyl-CoA dehydratase [Candidatus Neomarinimicrobiota bacterium]
MPRLQSQAILKSVLKDYFTGLSAPIAWCTSAGPAELLRAMGFQVYFPENHGALLGASRAALKYIPHAHQAGYQSEVCSYLTADIGAWLMKETPLTQAYGLPSVPKPDFIVFNTNQCREVAEWFNFFGREFDCPVMGIFPPRYVEEISQHHIDDVASQFKELIAMGEKIIGKKMDPEKLAEIVTLSKEGSHLWKQVLDTGKSTPAPITFFDGCILMAPIVVLRGTQICIDFYKEALKELTNLKNSGIGHIPDEKIRIYWEGMPIWGRLKWLSQLFAENQTSVVASTYCNSWVFDDFDPDNPIDSMAYAYTQIFINRGENSKLDMMKSLLKTFNVDGVVFHDSKTCFSNANNRFGLPNRLKKETGIDVLNIDGDLNDLRFFSDGQTKTKLETFIEQLQMKKSAG